VLTEKGHVVQRTSLTEKCHNLVADETGAVTVDWVVLTAMVVLLASSVAFVVRSGTVDLATSVSDMLVAYELSAP
jgi:hypothetical protein